MNRSDFQQLSELRLKEAEALLNQGYYDGAYYLLGYSVECAFKACIAKQTKQHDFPPNRKIIDGIYNHDPNQLLKASTLGSQHQAERLVNAAFDNNWKTLEAWSEQSRYELGSSEQKVKGLHTAVVGDEGVLTWLKRYW